MLSECSRQEESTVGIELLHGPIEDIGAIFISVQKHFMCINSFSSQNNLVVVFVIFSILEMETMKPREVK